MKTKLVICGFLLMLLCTTPIIVATSSIPTIRLPTDFVTMNAVYGNTSYFKMTLSDIPLGYDIINGTYQGWCVQENIKMTQHINHTVLLYSCYDPSLPLEYQNSHWDKINYLLNHKRGNSNSIQQAIWYYTDNKDCSGDPDALAMISNAEQHGTGFIPTVGELLAVPIKGVPTIQLTFLETTIPAPSTLEGLIWDDTNANGLQDNGEPGMNAITIHLYLQDNFLINTTTTNSKGYYHFTNLPKGAYYLQVTLRTGYHFSPQDIGTDDTVDSDVNVIGITPVFLITTDQSTQRWDAGMYTTSSHKPSNPQNHQPTADGTAGEPYNGFVQELIIFDGSRSYDQDGRIITWRWSYGDGISESGEITTHSYNQTGNYTVTLTVTDNQFASDVYTTIAHITRGNNPPSPPAISGPTFGHVHVMYEYLFVATDQDNDTIRYIINWNDEHTDTTTYFTSGLQISITHLWETYGFYTLRVYTQDQHNAISAISQMNITIDVQYVGTLGYLIDSNGDGVFDLFHSNSTSIETPVKILDNGNYLIDTNGDGDWDIIYNPTTRQYQEYHAIPILEYLLFILLIIAFLLLYLIIRIKRQTRTLNSSRKK
jgi:PKD repeat protein